MSRGRPVARIELTDCEREKLTLLARRPKTAQRDSLRARIVLEAANGLKNVEIAKKLGVTNITVGKWRRRFLESRLSGLVDAFRSGTPKSISDAKVEEVVTKTLENKPDGKTHWSTRSMC